MGSEARTRVALLFLLVVTLFSFGQVFDRGNWPGPALLAMLLAGLITVGARRLGIGTLETAVVSLVALVWYCAIVFRMDDLFYGLPTPEAMAGLRSAIRAAYAKSSLDYAPVPIRTGYVILEVIGMWFATTIAEIATFRWRHPLVAVMPVIALFSLLTIVGTGTGTTFLMLFFLSSLLSFLALESSHRLRSWGSWITSLSDRNAETPGEVSSRLARRMGASCLAAALFAPVFLPTIGDGLLSWRNNVGAGSGNGLGGGGGEVDLLASLKPRIIEQSQADMLEVRAATADYWRLTSLVEFDGTLWTPLQAQPRQPLLPGNRVAAEFPPRLFETLTQRVVISGLEGEFLPAAGQPDTVAITQEVGSRDNADLSYQLETGTIQMSEGLAEGLGYEVTSLVARPTFKEMKNAAIGQAPDVYYYEGLIPISPEVEKLIEDWTGRFDSPFEKLVALQDNLRLFTYTTDVEASASTDQLTEFLIRTRRGYCQQFAAAFALMARRLGFPSRVSVGFLPGDTNLAEPDRFTVKGTDAHAWPEVLFQDHGWVRFEPTPGNEAAPPAYTSRFIPFQAQNPFSDIGNGRSGADLAAGIAGNQPDPGRGLRGAEVPGADSRARRGRSEWEKTFSQVLSLLLLSVLLFIALVPLLKLARTWWRYRLARTPAELAAASFAHFEREAAELAQPRARSESASAFARRMGTGYRVPKSQALRLAAIYEAATYARDGIVQSSAQEAKQLARFLGRELWSGAGLWHKLRRLFSPGELFAR